MSVELFEKMLVLQDTFNKRVHDNWKEQGFNWGTAIWVECGELIDHLGYKWWKKQEPDLKQVTLELVDIWHFGMSYIMDGDDTELDILSNYINMNYEKSDAEPYDEVEFKRLVALLVNKITDELPWFATGIFFRLWKMLGYNVNDLYKMYIGKNALNEFRQRNGYKEGTYIKIWNGKEDNEVLHEMMDTLEIDADLFENVLVELEKEYSLVGE